MRPPAAHKLSALVTSRRNARRRATACARTLLLALLCLFLTQTARAQTCVANPGKDNPGGTLGGVVNTYYPGAATANSGATTISLGTSNIDGAATGIAIGDLLLVIQMQDAAINTSNNTAYGANNGSGSGATALNNTGRYEYVVALSAVGTGGGTVTIRGTGTGNGLLNTYTNAAFGAQGQRRFQVVRVPQYSSATLGSGLTAAPWDGTSGGILVFDVAGTLALGSASPNVNGMGFRGGGGRQLQGANNGGANTDYRNLATRNFHGQKGEGIAGTPRYVYDPSTGTVLDTGVEGYVNGSSARGAPGNAGGGGTDDDPTTASPSGNDQNSGGGGGGNGGDGGAGGNTWSTNSAIGGVGGDQVTGAANLVIMGGGGGAGSRNNSATIASSGGAGGGIVMIRAGAVSGSGTISANGADAYNFTDNDGAGGGGAGGSVVVSVANGTLAGLTINARGGRGGNAWSGQAAGTFPGERHGPGGGGGGGFIATTGGAAINVSGGANGTTTTANDAYGATAGGNGQSLTLTATQVPGVSAGGQCVPALTVTKTTSTPTVNNTTSGVNATYTIVVANAANRNAATSLAVSDTLPTNLTYLSTGTVTLAGGATRPTTTNPTVGDAVPNWTSFSIPGGGSVSLTFTVKVAAGVSGVQQNPATATYLDPARTVANGTTSASYNSASSTNEDVNVVAPTDITIAKSHTGNFTQGQSGTYSITVTNSGGIASSGTVTVTDTLPAGLTPGTATGTGWTCNTAAQTVTCTRADALAAGASYPVISVPVTVANNASLSLTNTATVSGGNDSNTGNNSSSDPTTINGVADVTIAKTHTGNFTQGQNGTYTITASNVGGAATSGTVTVSDTLPAGLTYVSATGTGWTCGAAGQVVTCTRADALAAGASYPAITLTVSVAPNSALSLTNTAAVSGGGQTNTSNDSASDPTTVNGVADLTVVKSHTGNFTQGQNGTYTITASNAGGAATSGTVTVSDTLPAGLSYVSATGTGWTCGASGQTVTCTRADALAAGASYPAITLTVAVASNSALSLTNTATVSGGGQTNTANDSSSDPTTVNGVADVTIAKSHSGNFTQGQSGSYTLTVSNVGGAATSGTVTVTDTVPAGLTSPTASGTGWTCNTAGQTITCTRATALAAGASYPAITVNVTVATNSPLSLTNTASVSGGGQTNTSNDSASDPTTVNGVADVTIAKLHTGNFSQGQSGATYTLTVSNAGGAATSGTVTVTDTLPASLAYVSATGTGWTCGAAGQVVTCTRATALAAGASYPAITVTVNVSTTAPSSVTNTGSVSGGGQTNTSNDSASDPTNINGVADLTVAKTHSGNFTRGSTGSYSIVVSNAGGAATSGTVTVTDTLPAGLTPSTQSGTGWTCGAVGQTITCTRSDALASGASYPAITVVVNVSQTAASSVTNTAAVSGGGQTNTSNDGSSDPTNVVSSSDLSLAKTVNNPSPVQGSNVTFTLTLTNAGPSNATNVAVTDLLPAGLTFVSATPSAGTYTSGTGVWSVASLASGANATLQIVATVANSGTITNTAEVTASDQPDPDSTPNNGNPAEDDRATASVGAAAPPSIGLVKSVTPSGTQLPGTDLTYTIAFSNTGGFPASAFVLTDPDPSTVLKINDYMDFKVGSVVNTLGTTGLTVVVAYSNNGGATWTYTPASGAGGAPAGYDRNVTHIRWSFAGSLSHVSPNNAGSVSFTARIR